MKPIKVHIIVALLIRIMLSIFFFMVCRVVFYLYNLEYYPDTSWAELLRIFQGGWVFDLSVLLVLNALYSLSQLIPFKIKHNPKYQKATLWLHFVPVSIGFITNIADTVYYKVALKRTTIAVFSQFENEENLGGLFLIFFAEYWYMLLLAFGLIVIFYWINNKIKVTPAPRTHPVVYFFIYIAWMLAIATLNVGGIRGDFKSSTRPITLSNASKYTSRPTQRAIVLNTPFAFLRSLGKTPLKSTNYFDTIEEQEKYYTAFQTGNGEEDSLFTQKNVVLIIIESMGREHFGVFNKHRPDYKGFTPFLDSLVERSFSIKHAFSNGRKSISAMPSCVSSVPSLIEPFILSHYSGNKVMSLASILNNKGYSTAFFHGAPNGSMGFDAFASHAGFHNYYGMTEYDNDENYDGHWGIWDEEFMLYFADKMSEMKQPFFTSLFTLSSHHPFRVPTKYQGHFPKGKLEIQESVGYTDYSLRQFFEKAKKMPWFDNTLFVITADHPATFSDLPEYKSSSGLFAVPFIMYDPSGNLPKGIDTTRVAQQIDIMPTVLDYLNYSQDYIAFGSSQLDSTAMHFGIGYLGGQYHYFQDRYLILFDGEKATSIYDYQNDILCQNNLIGQLPIQKQLVKRVKAFVQEYNRRMITNDMTIKEQ